MVQASTCFINQRGGCEATYSQTGKQMNPDMNATRANTLLVVFEKGLGCRRIKTRTRNCHNRIVVFQRRVATLFETLGATHIFENRFRGLILGRRGLGRCGGNGRGWLRRGRRGNRKGRGCHRENIAGRGLDTTSDITGTQSR
jgi:hypothetical protein